MKLAITVDGKTYEVDVEVSEPEPARPVPMLTGGHVRMPAAPPVAVTSRAADGADSVADESRVCRSPVSGVVTRVVTQPGQAVQVGDILLVLEAMKMETNITAPVEAKVAKVNVAVGDAVRSGQVLVEFE
jgi:methylmalonyl-CoA carboxyltransferase small subunit